MNIVVHAQFLALASISIIVLSMGAAGFIKADKVCVILHMVMGGGGLSRTHFASDGQLFFLFFEQCFY